jgi:hypothetical protein
LDARSAAAGAWDPHVSGDVSALARSGSTLYAGGGFGAIGHQGRLGLAAFDLPSGDLTLWDPGTDQFGVAALAVRGRTVYAGGPFRTIAGQAIGYLAALDARTGRPLEWDAKPDFDVDSLVLRHCLVVAGGEFDGALAAFRPPDPRCH